jgi:hypothetical protein
MEPGNGLAACELTPDPMPNRTTPANASLKQKLLASLVDIAGFTAEPSKVAGGTALFFRGKEFAHFHHDNEIDLRLGRKLIKDLGLSHPAGSTFHPTRSMSSQWIEVPFHSDEEVRRVEHLVKLAIGQLQ